MMFQRFRGLMNRRRSERHKRYRRPAAARHRRFLLEPLERRFLLAPLVNSGTANDMVINLPASANEVFLEGGNGTFRLLSGNNTFDPTTFARPNIKLQINRGNPADTITVQSLDLNLGMNIGSPDSPLAKATFSEVVSVNFVQAWATTVNVQASATISLKTGFFVCADDVQIDSAASLNAGAGDPYWGFVSFVPLTVGRAIDVGGETAGKLSLTNAELGRITASELWIGEGIASTVTVSAPITLGSTLKLGGSEATIISQPVTLAAGRHFLVYGSGLDASFTVTSTGSVTVSGIGSIAVGAGAIDLAPNSSLNAGFVGFYSAPGQGISLGTETSGQLSLTDAELDRIVAGSLAIGQDRGGALTISADITRASATEVDLRSGEAINFIGGSIDTGGGNLILSAGDIAIGVSKAGHDIVLGSTGTLSFNGSDLAIAINGTAVDTQYQQLNVAGLVDLTGADLVLSGQYQPAIGDVFVLVNNDGTEQVIGNFNGLDEQEIFAIPSGALQGDYRITYRGGDGNDVVLAALNDAPTLQLAGYPGELGAELVADVNPGASSSFAGPFAVVNDIVYFRANDGTTGYELWKSDGTVVGTALVKNIGPDTNGPTFGGLAAGSFTNYRGHLYFPANDGTNGYELWKSDGTAAGTVLVQDIYAGASSSYAGNHAELGNELLFMALDEAHGRELWKTDGTATGTMLVKDIQPGPNGSYPGGFVEVSGKLFFLANDGSHGTELWQTDGTTAGTVLVADVRTGPETSLGNYLVNLNGNLLFRATDGVHGYDLWKSDGTSAGTVLIKDTDSSPLGPQELTNVNGTVFFHARDAANAFALWKSDGTAAGTSLVRAFGDSGSNGYVAGLVNLNGTLFFIGSESAHGSELWKSDGTTDGTVIVKDIVAGSGDSDPIQGVNVGGRLYFQANDGVHGNELWQSDGTEAGTVLVRDIRDGVDSSYPGYLTNANGTLFFMANDGVHGYEIWKAAIQGAVLGAVLEDATVQTTNLVGISAGIGESQSLMVTATSSNPELIPNPKVSYDGQNSTGSISYRPSADRFGTAVITVTVKDDGGTANGGTDTFSRSFTVEVTPVNDAPHFVKGIDKAATDEDPVQVADSWATNLAKGPPTAADEAGQTLEFVVTNDSSGLFVEQPAIDATGKLTFKPQANVAGSARVSVVLKDDGGTASGGDDASDTQTFTITITKEHVWHNAVNGLDVTGPGGLPDGHVVAGDALEIINFINAFGSQPVPTDGRATGPYCDVNADGSVAPGDALDVINHINAFGAGEGESLAGPGGPSVATSVVRSLTTSVQPSLNELLALLATDVASLPKRRIS